MAKGGEASFSREVFREYLETWLHHQMAPLAKWLVKNHPSLAVDKLWEVGATWLLPLAEGAVRKRFGKQIASSEIRSMVFEIGTDLVRELISEMKELGENPEQAQDKKEQPKTEVVVFPTIWTSIANSDIGFVDGCSVKHQFVMKPVTKKRKGAPDEQGEEPVARDGFFLIEFADFIDGGGRGPVTPAEGWKNGCCCKTRIAEAKAKLLAQRDAKSKAEAPKPKTEPLVTRDEIRRAGTWALNQAGTAVKTVVAAGKVTGLAAAAAGVAVGRKVQAVDGTLQTTDAKWAADIRTRTQQIKAEHAARVAGRKK